MRSIATSLCLRTPQEVAGVDWKWFVAMFGRPSEEDGRLDIASPCLRTPLGAREHHWQKSFLVISGRPSVAQAADAQISGWRVCGFGVPRVHP